MTPLIPDHSEEWRKVDLTKWELPTADAAGETIKQAFQARMKKLLHQAIDDDDSFIDHLNLDLSSLIKQTVTEVLTHATNEPLYAHMMLSQEPVFLPGASIALPEPRDIAVISIELPLGEECAGPEFIFDLSEAAVRAIEDCEHEDVIRLYHILKELTDRAHARLLAAPQIRKIDNEPMSRRQRRTRDR